MPRDLSIADRCRDLGLRVVEVAGWQDRGSSDFNPRGSVCHHTAGGANGTCPSLDGVIHGFSGSADGPLANALQSREADGNDIIYVVAAGRANHAGSGGWHGLSGNSSVYGLEVEHTGVVPLPEGRQRIAARFHAAMARGRFAADMVCQHREWAPDRKIDTAQDVDPDRFRRWVSEYMHGGPTPPPVEEPDMWTINAQLERGSRDIPDTFSCGLPAGGKGRHVDVYCDAEPDQGVAAWACQHMDGTNFPLWDTAGWELWLPGRQPHTFDLRNDARGVTIRTLGGEGSVLVTVSGT